MPTITANLSTSEYVQVNNGLDSVLMQAHRDPVAIGWELRGVEANNDYGYLMTLDLTRLGFTSGIKLDKGTLQRLVITIRDDITIGVNVFNCIAYGFDRFE